jgi:hypothetical protein
MKNLFLALAFMLVSSISFGKNNVIPKLASADLYVCTVTTTTTIVDGYGESNQVSVTNTANDCFSAWSANQDEIKKMKKGLEGAQ